MYGAVPRFVACVVGAVLVAGVVGCSTAMPYEGSVLQAINEGGKPLAVTPVADEYLTYFFEFQPNVRIAVTEPTPEEPKRASADIQLHFKTDLRKNGDPYRLYEFIRKESGSLDFDENKHVVDSLLLLLEFVDPSGAVFATQSWSVSVPFTSSTPATGRTARCDVTQSINSLAQPPSAVRVRLQRASYHEPAAATPTNNASSKPIS